MVWENVTVMSSKSLQYTKDFKQFNKMTDDKLSLPFKASVSLMPLY